MHVHALIVIPKGERRTKRTKGEGIQAVKQATYILDKDYAIGEVDKRLFGSFVEHLGRTVYNGIYEPGHALSDEQGFRNDVIDCVKEANISLVRYPGGNFVSGYDWTDGIGPVEKRPKRLDLAWSAVETNRVGIDEFADWTRKAGVELMAAVNLGTGTPREAGNLIEYCNHPSGSSWSDLRRANGHEKPHGIRLWCLGNEMDGEWQIGALGPDDYAKKALETAKIMRMVDSRIELVACGSCCCETPTYPDWDRIVLERLYDKIDYLSLHRYYTYDAMKHLFYASSDDRTDIPHFSLDLQDFLHTVISAADLVKTKLKSKKVVNISFDEWNVISSTNPPANHPESWRETQDSGEEIFSMQDTLVYGGLLCTFLRNTDRVKIACQSLLVNTGGMFYTKKGGALVRNPVFYPFQQVATYARGVSLLDKMRGPSVTTHHYGVVPALQSAAVFNEADGALSIFIVSFDTEPVQLSLDLRSFGALRPIEHIVTRSDSLSDINSVESPRRVIPQTLKLGTGERGGVTALIPGSSWNVLRFSTRAGE